MDQDVSLNREESTENLSGIVVLPAELLVYILSFLKNVRDSIRFKKILNCL